MSDREKLKRYIWITIAIMLIGFAIGLIFIDIPLLCFLGLVIMIGGLYFQYKTFVCPHCGSSLLGMRFIPDHCPHCGKEIK